MNTLTKSLLALAASATVGLSTVVPAVAVPYSSGYITFGDTTNGTSWGLDDREGTIAHSLLYVDGVVFDQITHYSSGLKLDGNIMTPNDDFDISVDAVTGDQVVVGTGTYGTLDASVEYRAYTDGDLFRQVFLLTNNTGSTITVTPSTMEDISDFASDNATTSSGDIALTTADYWYTQFDTLYDGVFNGVPYTSPGQTVVYSKFWGSPDHVTVSAIGPELDLLVPSYDDVTFGDITLSPGDSYQWIHFHSMKSYDIAGDEAADEAAAIAAGVSAQDEFGGDAPSLDGSGRLSYGLDLSIPSNWFPGDVELADTGVEAGLSIAVGVTLLAAGIAIAMRKRRLYAE